MAKQGDKYVCGVCGLEVICVEGCGCRTSKMICCTKPMKKKAPKKVKKVKRTAKKKKKRK